MALTEEDMTSELLKRIQERKSLGYSRVTQNVSPKTPFNYGSSPDIDVLEFDPENDLFYGYELKGERKKEGEYVPPANYEGIGQALFYLHMPVILENDCEQMGLNYEEGEGSGIIDYAYLVQPVEKIEIDNKTRQLFENTPIGLVLALKGEKDGEVANFKVSVEASKNPIQSKAAKGAFIEHLEVLAPYKRTH